MPIEMVLNARVPVKVWTDRIEPEAIEQLKNIANLPVVFPHVAAKPAVHLGKGATVGAVVPTKDAVCPAAEAFESAPHGAGRRMSRSEARRRFTAEDLVCQTEGVECRKDARVVDEIPEAYKPIEEVIEKSSDLVEVVAFLRQVICVKG